MSNNPHPEKLSVQSAEFANDLSDNDLLTYLADLEVQLPGEIREKLVEIAADMKLDELKTEPEPDI